MRRLALTLLAGCTVAAAASTDWGWTKGKVAANAAAVLEGPKEPAKISLPKSIVKRVDKPTVLFYFSPTCPHCQHVAREVGELHKRLGKHGAQIVGVASSSSQPDAIKMFKAEYGIDFEIVHDADGEIGTAMAVRSTPSALLAVPLPGAKVEVQDLWYPYLPGFGSLIEGRVRGDVFSVFEEDRYHGNNFCGACHTEEFQSWSVTHHSVAWRTLELKEKTGDSECTGCHVTGNEADGGWAGDPNSRLVDVGCESCHSAGGPHDGKAVDALTQCESCHDKKHSIAFEVGKGVPLIDHFKGPKMTEKAYRERRMALYKGEAPRELLAFAEGPHVGAEACKSCHEAEYTAWKESPHHHAMAVLEDQGEHTNVDCVKCHATPKKSGPPPTKMDGYRPEEGVSCEDCHGPGGKHVAAEGGTDNIEGLGESCPVCVIEAVCTRCHNGTWDPEWDLEARMQGVRIQHKPAVPSP